MSSLSTLDPERTMSVLEEGMLGAIKDFFPIEGRLHRLELKKIYGDSSMDIDDIVSQKRARLRGRTWAKPIYGDFDLVDKVTGKKISSSSKTRLLNLPHFTNRFSFIIDGTEYQADSQWRLKSGAYTREKANGELETQFNLAKGRGFRLGFTPQKRKFIMSVGTTNVPLLPVLQALGIPNETIREAWGNEVFAAASGDKRRGQMQRLAKVLDRRSTPTTDEEAAAVVRDVLSKTVLREDTTKATLGKAFSTVNGDALLLAANKLLGVSRGTDVVDNRDSLKFKELWTVSDHLPERLRNSKRRIDFKIRNNIDKKVEIKRIITPDVFNVPVKAFFTSTSIPQQSTQVNPIDMIGGHLRTTLMGTGGISSDNAVSASAKLLDNSQLGFTDPVHTPEGIRSGVTTHLALGVSKRGHDPVVKVWNTRTKKVEERSPAELSEATVAFADQYTVKDGQYSTDQDRVTVIPKGGGDPAMVKPDGVDYVMRSSRAMFSFTANAIPFLASDQANRAGMATRHMEQAISLKHREEPLVQVLSGSPKGDADTWEKIAGKFQSQRSPVAGVVTAITADRLTVTGADKKPHVVQLYDNFPLNEKKAFITSTPLVSVGDTVKAGQSVADSNFTRGGVLALGTNLRIGYLPYKGLVFEDGVVISESSSEKLTSEHLHKNRVYLDTGMGTGKRRFRANFPGVLSEANAAKLDEDGLIRKGEMVKPGDVIATVLKKTEPTAEQAILRGIHKSLARPYKDKSLVWDKSYTGEVTDVVRNGQEIVVYVRTEEKADIGDKVSGRHGNKGIITAVLPDAEMPRDKEGNPLEIIVNPSGVPSRINLGQMLETSLGKVAFEQGKPYAVANFATEDGDKISSSEFATRTVKVGGHYRTVTTKKGKKRVWIEAYQYETGYQGMVKKVLEEAGVSETTELFDAQTGKSLGPIFVGRQYIIKHMHQIDKKLTARAHGYGYAYDANMTPKSTGKGDSAQKFGELGLYAMLAHGATANIRDALTYKSDRTQDEIWTAIQTGQIPPAPKPSFAYEKFLAYLSALGVNVEKEGNEISAMPLTGDQILELSNGELVNGSKVIRGKDLKPEKGGLFDPEITGGPGGKNWSHLALSEPLPNPIFEKSVRSLLGLTGTELDAIVGGRAGYTKDGKYTEEGELGPASLVAALEGIDVDAELTAAKEKIKTARRSELDKVNKKVKYLLMLKRTGLTPRAAYVLDRVPVLPPMFRPVTPMEGGDLNVDGLNLLYRDVALLSGKLGEAVGVLPPEQVVALRGDLYSAIEALMGTNSVSDQGLTAEGLARPPGILTLLAGRRTPKESFFHKRMLDRKQDVTLRSVIVPDMTLHLDEMGIPTKGAMKIFQPFVVKELHNMGFTPLQAREEIDKGTPLARRALEIAASKRPVLFKRDPVLHKFGIMAFKARLIDSEKAIHIHPLVTSGFNADFDGDAMSVFVPITQEAVDEAYKMMPSKNLFNPATGKVMYQPTLEGQLGLYLMTQFGTKTKLKFDSEKEVAEAGRKGTIRMTDVVSLGGKQTTAGRVAFNGSLPKSIRSDDILYNPETVIGKKTLQGILRQLATKKPGEFATTIDKVKDLGFAHAYNIGFSFDLGDFDALRDVRDKHLKKAKIKVAALSDTLSPEARDAAIVAVYQKTTADIAKDAKVKLGKNGNKLFAMHQAGVKPGWSQLSQMILAPMLMENAKGRIIPVPVTRSYSEGLDAAGYWTASSGARKGLIDKVAAVREPGALSKQIINAVIPLVVTQDNCGTKRGVVMKITDADMVDRFLAKPVKMRGETISSGTVVTPALLSKFKAAKVDQASVRSPTKCESAQGMCSRCYGLADGGSAVQIGTNIGIMAGQSIGERATQLSMRTFHTGGVAGAGSSAVGGLARVQQLLKMPQILPNKATLATQTAKITAISPSPVGGFDVKVGTEAHYVPSNRTLKIKVGDSVRRGDALSSGAQDPRELLSLTNIDRVQRYLTDEIHKVYASEGIKRRNIEVMVRSLTNLGVVEDPGEVGEAEGLVRNDYVSVSKANAWNKQSKGQTPVKIVPVLRGIETLALDQTTDWLARLQYRKLKETLTRAPSEGWKSDIHGLHPTPGIAFSAEFGKPKTPAGGPY